ncbi:MAG: hypothetical protein AAGI49_05505 [Bacteroidota bacterium]
MLTFTCRANQRYIVIVEEYPYEVLVLKFYLKNHRDSQKKYQLLSKLRMASGIISTCTHILLYFLEKKDTYSFGFVGAPTLDEESNNNTKRFQLYSTVMKYLISNVRFTHLEFEAQSAYLMINNEIYTEKIRNQMIDFFNTHYVFEEL